MWVCDADRWPVTHSLSVANSDIHAHADSNTHAEPHADSDSNSDIYTNSNAYSDANAGIYTHTDFNSDADSNPNAYANSNADPRSFYRDARSHVYCPIQPQRNPSGGWHCPNHRRDQQQAPVFHSACMLHPVSRTL